MGYLWASHITPVTIALMLVGEDWMGKTRHSLKLSSCIFQRLIMAWASGIFGEKRSVFKDINIIDWTISDFAGML